MNNGQIDVYSFHGHPSYRTKQPKMHNDRNNSASHHRLKDKILFRQNQRNIEK